LKECNERRRKELGANIFIFVDRDDQQADWLKYARNKKEKSIKSRGGNKLADVKIIDETGLVKIFRTISWLDLRRWNVDDNYNFINFFRDDLLNHEKILTHWICYITDRQMPFELVWDKGGYVFSNLVYKYIRTELSPLKILNQHYEKYNDHKGKEHFRFKSSHNGTFASRYVTDDYQNILQTLEVLDKQDYKRNIIVYVINVLRKYQGAEDLLIRVACALYLLTYRLDRKKANSDEIVRTLNDENEFDKKLQAFKRTSTSGKKRLWCCIRDYKKGQYCEIFNKAIKEVAGEDAGEIVERWNELPMNQIELPGDVWNNSPLFRENLFPNVINIDDIPKTWEMPKIIKVLFNQLKNNKELTDFYPEQFDITFDFVPRMCAKNLCKVCLFGMNGVDSICIPSQDKYCPVALLSCGYIERCVGLQGNCIIRDGISKGICKGRSKALSQKH